VGAVLVWNWVGGVRCFDGLSDGDLGSVFVATSFIGMH
jgi:hypothetical protein